MDLGTARPHIASYIILRKGNKVLLLLRKNVSWMSGYYGLPAGKVEKGEAFIRCAIREAREEIGLELKERDMHIILTMHRNSPDNGMDWVDIFFEVDEWSGEPTNAEPEVHSELAWIDLDALPENIVPNVKFALEQIKLGNTYCEFGWS